MSSTSEKRKQKLLDTEKEAFRGLIRQGRLGTAIPSPFPALINLFLLRSNISPYAKKINFVGSILEKHRKLSFKIVKKNRSERARHLSVRV